jgi:hypothetical protein
MDNILSLPVDGLLPSGDHHLTLSELRQSYLVTGEGLEIPQWDSAWRRQLVDNLELFVRQLWHVGVERIFVNGSFVTSKPDPGDIDAYFECTVAEYPLLLAQLTQLEPPLPWDVTRRPIDPRSREAKPIMWHRYRMEVFPHFIDHPMPTGIRDTRGDDLFFPTLFRLDKATGRPKGIVQIIRE